MALLGKILTEREKAAIYYHVYGGCEDWRLLYCIAYDAPVEIPEKDNYLFDKCSKWKRSPKVQNFLNQIRDQKAVKENRIKEAAALDAIRDGECVRKEKTRNNSVLVDYSNPENQRKKLNELVNSASDPGEALDALKVIISGQRDDRQAAKEQRQVRAYLPITCESCPLYIINKKQR